MLIHLIKSHVRSCSKKKKKKEAAAKDGTEYTYTEKESVKWVI